MSSSSLLVGREVDVFLSFCCETPHVSFVDDLCQNGITSYLSDRYLEKTIVPMSQRTHKALEESKVAVVMTSEREPCSIGFLEELIEIIKLHEKGSLTVIPLYIGSFSFDVEEEICQRYPDKAASWKTALTTLGNIAAEYPFSLNPLSDQLKQIAQDVSLMFLSSTSHDLNPVVAMDRHMKVVYDLLASQVKDKEVCTVGIWGSSGVGKTTLARYIFAAMSANFQTHVFLENVENMKDKILKFEGEEDPTMITRLDQHAHEIANARRKHHQVLLIVDDVNNIDQGKWIIEYANWFASGSRVILINENKNLLVDAGVMDVYEVTTPRYDEALQLFSHFAFKQPYPPCEFEQLAVRAVKLAGFLPLALRLLGSFLTDKSREEWLDALLKLKAKHGGNIIEVWKLMETSDGKGEEEWEAATDRMKEIKLSEKVEAAAVWKGKESSEDKDIK